MKRVLLLAALCAPLGATAAPPSPVSAPAPPRIETWFDAFQPRLHPFQIDLAGLLHDAAAPFVAALASIPAPVPDISMLTTQPIPQTVSSGYGWRDDPIRHTWRFHGGTDFPAHFGTPVLAAGAGKVAFAGRQGGYGNVVYIDHGGGVVTLYGHMQRILTKKDALVAAGDNIGQVGATGRATGPHLHFEIRLDNHPVDPVKAMSIAEVWRESPTAAHVMAYQLTPDVQKHLRAFSDRHAHARDAETSDKPTGPRPERKGHATRALPSS